MSTKRTHLVVGLGNPGKAYERTRHNAGFLVIDALAGRYDIPVNRRKFDALYGRGTVDGADVVLVKPMTYMNLSGSAVQPFSHFFKIACRDILVVHDDIDLAFGRLKIKQKGGHGGHKGVSSIMDALGEGNFTRLRIGIGRPEAQTGVTGHVLGGFTTEEEKTLERITETAREAVVTVLSSGIREGMNRFNDRRTQFSS